VSSPASSPTAAERSTNLAVVSWPWSAESDLSQVPQKKKPHVVLILADDYGWGNIGVHRRLNLTDDQKQAQAEVHTPNLDSLIRHGVLLDRHYAYKICSPSRSSLQSGRLAVHVNSVNTGVTYWNPGDNVSGFAGIPRNMTGLAQKMKEGGYSTHMVGKWDAGMATPQHTPIGKGYDTWLGYFQHANDYWDEGMPLASTGNLDICENRFVDFSLYNETYRGPVSEAIRKELGCEMRTGHLQTPNIFSQVNATGCNELRNGKFSKYCLSDSCYEEAMFNTRALNVIRDHDTSDPLFLFYAFHLLHTPLQVPMSYLTELDRLVEEAGGRPIDSANRRLYAAMVLYMDTMVGNLVAALKDRSMYQDTLIVFMADNGGPVYEPGSGNNHPLKGGKYSDWEGGVRTNAFVSGGYVPAERRGKTFEGIISIADWYATLSTIAGVDYYDFEANETNSYLYEQGLPPLPPVDGRPQWNNIVKDTNGREYPLHLSENAVLHWPFKLVTGKQEYSFYQGELYPNCTTVMNIADGPLFSDFHIFGANIKLSANETVQDELTYTQDCGYGGLYNVLEDPEESKDLSGDPAYADTLLRLLETLYDMNRYNFNPDRGSAALQACNTSADLGGFYGPFVDVETFYKGLEPLNCWQRHREEKIKAKLKKLNTSLDRTPEFVTEEFIDKFGIRDFMMNHNLSDGTLLDTCLAENANFN